MTIKSSDDVIYSVSSPHSKISHLTGVTLHERFVSYESQSEFADLAIWIWVDVINIGARTKNQDKLN